MCRALGRQLVLPAWICYCDSFWEAIVLKVVEKFISCLANMEGAEVLWLSRCLSTIEVVEKYYILPGYHEGLQKCFGC